MGRDKLGDVQVQQLHSIGWCFSFLHSFATLVGQCLVSPGAACGTSVFPCSCHSMVGEAQSDARVPGSRGRKNCAKSDCFRLFACFFACFFFSSLFLRTPVPRFSYMIEQLTAAKSLRPEHSLALYILMIVLKYIIYTHTFLPFILCTNSLECKSVDCPLAPPKQPYLVSEYSEYQVL